MLGTRGVEENHEKSIEWLRKAAEQEWVQAQFLLGACYADGQGTETDVETGIKWSRKALRTGYRTLENFDESYLFPLDTEAVREIDYFKMRGQIRLAEVYSEGIETEKDLEESVRRYRDLADVVFGAGGQLGKLF